MNFGHYINDPVRYAVDLVNTYDPVSARDDLQAASDLASFGAERGVDRPIGDRDLDIAREVRESLREVFTENEMARGAERANDLLARFNSAPRIVFDDDIGYHIHFEPAALNLGPWLGAVTAAGISFLIVEYGIDRLGVCAAPSCSKVYVDWSKNVGKRYCSARCSRREAVAAYRARKATTEEGGVRVAAALSPPDQDDLDEQREA